MCFMCFRALCVLCVFVLYVFYVFSCFMCFMCFRALCVLCASNLSVIFPLYQSVLGRGHLGFLLACAFALSHQFFPQIRANNKFFIMVRPAFFQNLIIRRYTDLLLGNLLKMRLGIQIKLV